VGVSVHARIPRRTNQGECNAPCLPAGFTMQGKLPQIRTPSAWHVRVLQTRCPGPAKSPRQAKAKRGASALVLLWW